MARPTPSCAMVIFGAAGDLTKRLLIPALYNLRRTKLLPKGFAIIAVARDQQDDAGYRRDLGNELPRFATDKIVAPDWDWLAQRLHFLRGDFTDPSTYSALEERLREVDKRWHTDGNVLFYLATPPSAFAGIGRQLGEAGLLRESGGRWRRVIIEKPFGTDLNSARALNRSLLEVAGEPQLYRMDHFLGKETVQNIMALRFGNGFFEPLWNRDHIDHVQITVAETVGVEQRGGFYDATGALRDMVPNHLFQLLAMTAMEPPNSFDADAVRTEKEKALDAVLPMDARAVAMSAVRGQYTAGSVQGRKVKAYAKSPEVAARSTTETFVAVRLGLDNWRWAGVPFYLRTGKALAQERTEIAIKLKNAPFAMFRQAPCAALADNFLVLRIQPDEGIALEFNAKVPGPDISLDSVRMDFRYSDHFAAAPAIGYETLLYDCMIGDATLFQRADNVEAGWRIVQPILDAWAKAPSEGLRRYAAGGEGPAAAAELVARDGRSWRPLVAEAGT